MKNKWSVDEMKIAIIGGGIVGSTVAFYLSDEAEVVLYDAQRAQGTQAAVGIVSPWVNQRRNRRWYELANKGVHFYDQYLQDIEAEHLKIHRGSLHVNPRQHDKLWKIAQSRFEKAPAMQSISEVEGDQFQTPLGFKFEKGIWVEGSFQIDGSKLLHALDRQLEKKGVKQINKMVEVKKKGSMFYVDQNTYDLVVLATGAWTSYVLKSLNYSSRFREQKGELIVFDGLPENKWPLIIPQGEYDYLFQEGGRLVVGASHENVSILEDYANKSKLKEMEQTAKQMMPELQEYFVSETKRGFRSQTSEGVPLYGKLEDGLYLASGLGSSGLTTGPYLAYRLSEMIQGRMEEEDMIYDPLQFGVKKIVP